MFKAKKTITLFNEEVEYLKTCLLGSTLPYHARLLYAGQRDLFGLIGPWSDNHFSTWLSVMKHTWDGAENANPVQNGTSSTHSHGSS